MTITPRHTEAYDRFPHAIDTEAGNQLMKVTMVTRSTRAAMTVTRKSENVLAEAIGLLFCEHAVSVMESAHAHCRMNFRRSNHVRDMLFPGISGRETEARKLRKQRTTLHAFKAHCVSGDCGKRLDTDRHRRMPRCEQRRQRPKERTSFSFIPGSKSRRDRFLFRDTLPTALISAVPGRAPRYRSAVGEAWVRRSSGQIWIRRRILLPIFRVWISGWGWLNRAEPTSCLPCTPRRAGRHCTV